jgi:hypothetical protein
VGGLNNNYKFEKKKNFFFSGFFDRETVDRMHSKLGMEIRVYYETDFDLRDFRGYYNSGSYSGGVAFIDNIEFGFFS